MGSRTPTRPGLSEAFDTNPGVHRLVQNRMTRPMPWAREPLVEEARRSVLDEHIAEANSINSKSMKKLSLLEKAKSPHWGGSDPFGWGPRTFAASGAGPNLGKANSPKLRTQSGWGSTSP